MICLFASFFFIILNVCLGDEMPPVSPVVSPPLARLTTVEDCRLKVLSMANNDESFGKNERIFNYQSPPPPNEILPVGVLLEKIMSSSITQKKKKLLRNKANFLTPH